MAQIISIIIILFCGLIIGAAIFVASLWFMEELESRNPWEND